MFGSNETGLTFESKQEKPSPASQLLALLIPKTKFTNEDISCLLSESESGGVGVGINISWSDAHVRDLEPIHAVYAERMANHARPFCRRWAASGRFPGCARSSTRSRESTCQEWRQNLLNIRCLAHQGSRGHQGTHRLRLVQLRRAGVNLLFRPCTTAYALLTPAAFCRAINAAQFQALPCSRRSPCRNSADR